MLPLSVSSGFKSRVKTLSFEPVIFNISGIKTAGGMIPTFGEELYALIRNKPDFFRIKWCKFREMITARKRHRQFISDKRIFQQDAGAFAGVFFALIALARR
ncbi:hypothetical protein G8770_22990 [Aestuariicella hydrocarbonica]|uniref:Uncharacterized protein n=1 Tax=Pseudomaricurvus hydrocarbonicus TaxID=1470433 RepID=A0A9E5MQD2_9GAMM|nr:hypothetical protein [Aestuariicella hydrocarbonica]NHO68429.1 hypothetical protein [Aestuariicella hydrocarbonica]